MASNSYCFVPCCQSGYKNQRKEFQQSGKRVPSLFSVKKNDHEMLKRWRRVIPRADRQFSFLNKVCELHFQDDEIIRYDVHNNMPGGAILKMERERYALKPGAVPSIFPNVPPSCLPSFYRSDHTRKSELPDLHIIMPQKIQEEASTLDAEVPVNPYYLKDFHLKDCLEAVKLPSDWWEIHSTPHYVACARWNKEFVVERKIIVDDDQSVSIYIKDFKLKNSQTLTCADDMSLLIQEVDRYEACAGLSIGSNMNCLGILPPVNKPGSKSIWCKECKKS